MVASTSLSNQKPGFFGFWLYSTFLYALSNAFISFLQQPHLKVSQVYFIAEKGFFSIRQSFVVLSVFTLMEFLIDLSAFFLLLQAYAFLLHLRGLPCRLHKLFGVYRIQYKFLQLLIPSAY